MSATELAAVVEGWATVAGLMVVIAGAVFAGVQLRQQAKAQSFQTVMAVLSDVRSLEVGNAWANLVSKLPDGFDVQQVSVEELRAVRLVQGSYTQLGSLLAAGFVKEEDIFSFLGITKGAIETWEKSKHLPRANEAQGLLSVPIFHEYLAARAEAYLDRNGLKMLGRMPRFDSDPAIMARVVREVSQARSVV